MFCDWWTSLPFTSLNYATNSAKFRLCTSGKSCWNLPRFAYMSNKEPSVQGSEALATFDFILWEPLRLTGKTVNVVQKSFNDNKCIVSYALKSLWPTVFIMTFSIALCGSNLQSTLFITELKVLVSTDDLGSLFAAYTNVVFSHTSNRYLKRHWRSSFIGSCLKQYFVLQCLCRWTVFRRST